MGVGTEFVAPVTMARERRLKSKYDEGNSSSKSPTPDAFAPSPPPSANLYSFGRKIGDGSSLGSDPSAMSAVPMTREEKAANVDRLLQNKEGLLHSPQQRFDTDPGRKIPQESKFNAQRVQAERKKQFGKEPSSASNALRVADSDGRKREELSRSGNTFIQFGEPKQGKSSMEAPNHVVEVNRQKIEEPISRHTSEVSIPTPGIRRMEVSGSQSTGRARRLLEISNSLNGGWVDTNTNQFKREIGDIDEGTDRGVEKRRKDLELERIKNDYEIRFSGLRTGYQTEIQSLRRKIAGYRLEYNVNPDNYRVNPGRPLEHVSPGDATRYHDNRRRNIGNI